LENCSRNCLENTLYYYLVVNTPIQVHTNYQEYIPTYSGTMIVCALLKVAPMFLPTLEEIPPNFDLLDKDKAVLQKVHHYHFSVCRRPCLSSHHDLEREEILITYNKLFF